MRTNRAYGSSKIAGESYDRLAARQGLPTVVPRLGNVSRPGDRDRPNPLFAVADGVRLLITVLGRRKILDFVWIDVLVDALIKTAFGSYIRGSGAIGGGKRTTIVDLARRTVDVGGSVSEVQVMAERQQDVGGFVAPA